jgi:hypothetical protein
MSKASAYQSIANSDQHGSDQPVDESGSATSDREASTVTINLSSLHESIESKRKRVVQTAVALSPSGELPETAVLSNGSLEARNDPAPRRHA